MIKQYMSEDITMEESIKKYESYKNSSGMISFRNIIEGLINT